MEPLGSSPSEALRALLATQQHAAPAQTPESAPLPSAFTTANPDSASFSAEALARLADEGGT